MKLATKFRSRPVGTRRVKMSRRTLVMPKAEPPVLGAAEVAPAEPPPLENVAINGDSLQLYLREIGQVKLLTPGEEIALAKRIKRGDKHAREHMIKANLRLVVKIARD